MKITEHREEYLKSTAEEKGKLLAKTYGLAGHQVWKHKQSGKWIVSHAGIQSIAAQESICVKYKMELFHHPPMTVKKSVLVGWLMF